MGIDWDKFEEGLDGAINTAAEKTDERLAGRISSITRLTDDEIIKLFPKPSDVKKLTELMKIVKSAGRRNTKMNQIVTNIEDFSGIILTLLGKFA